MMIDCYQQDMKPTCYSYQQGMKPTLWVCFMLVCLIKKGRSDIEEKNIHRGKSPAAGANSPSCTNMGCPLKMYA